MKEIQHRGYTIEASAQRLPSGEYAPSVTVSWEEDGDFQSTVLDDGERRAFPTPEAAILLAEALGKAWVDGRG